MPEQAYRTYQQIADHARLRYETDAIFHARVYEAAQIARSAENHLGDLFSEDSALLGAAVALSLVEPSGSDPERSDAKESSQPTDTDHSESVQPVMPAKNDATRWEA